MVTLKDGSILERVGQTEMFDYYILHGTGFLPDLDFALRRDLVAKFIERYSSIVTDENALPITLYNHDYEHGLDRDLEPMIIWQEDGAWFCYLGWQYQIH